jgi:CRP-like cAMP-binding protein
VKERLDAEVDLVKAFKGALVIEKNETMRTQLRVQCDFATQRFLYYFAALSSKPRAVLNALPSILDGAAIKADRVRRADAINYLDLITPDASMRKQVSDVLESNAHVLSQPHYETLIASDPWLARVQTLSAHNFEENMDVSEKALFLGQVDLFCRVPIEILAIIAESIEEESFEAKTQLFSRGDEADKVYMVVNGSVSLFDNGEAIRHVEKYGFFGEVGLLQSGRRTADAITQGDVTLLTIQKLEFLQILEDVPEVSKSLIQMLSSYLDRIYNKA